MNIIKSLYTNLNLLGFMNIIKSLYTNLNLLSFNFNRYEWWQWR